MDSIEINNVHRVIVYVDGFNLYYGLRRKSWTKYYWLDVVALGQNILRPHHELVRVRYFTAWLKGSNHPKRARQKTYLEALNELPQVSMHFGQYAQRIRNCHKCGNSWVSYEEKMSDVNVAIALLNDAHDDAFDTAVLISRDSDLAGVVDSVLERYEEKRVLVAYPPGAMGTSLQNSASATFSINEKMLRNSQLPNEVVKSDGYILKRPALWR